MKKTLIAIAVLGILALSLGAAGSVYAQGGNPPTPVAPGSGRGPMTGGGVLHTYMTAEWAKVLNLSVDEINARLASGQTMYQIALDAGVKAEEFYSLMTTVRANAIAAAVKDGVLTQAQADWMNQMHSRMGSGAGTGYGPCMGGSGVYGGMMNGRRWNQANP
ncbi:MAG: hypothetical protein AB1564_00465 [Chloroflexota bacterium]